MDRLNYRLSLGVRRSQSVGEDGLPSTQKRARQPGDSPLRKESSSPEIKQWPVVHVPLAFRNITPVHGAVDAIVPVHVEYPVYPWCDLQASQDIFNAPSLLVSRTTPLCVGNRVIFPINDEQTKWGITVRDPLYFHKDTAEFHTFIVFQDPHHTDRYFIWDSPEQVRPDDSTKVAQSWPKILAHVESKLNPPHSAENLRVAIVDQAPAKFDRVEIRHKKVHNIPQTMVQIFDRSDQPPLLYYSDTTNKQPASGGLGKYRPIIQRPSTDDVGSIQPMGVKKVYVHNPRNSQELIACSLFERQLSAELVADPEFGEFFTKIYAVSEDRDRPIRTYDEDSQLISESRGSKIKIFMEHLDGIDVFECIQNLAIVRGTNRWDEVGFIGSLEEASQLKKEILYQSAQALMGLHAHGYIHRDVKPENIMVTFQPTGACWVKLIDYGMCHHYLDVARSRTQEGSMLYVAPEVLNPNQFASYATDIYAWGIMGIVILFETTDVASIVQALRSNPIKTDIIAQLHGLHPDFSEEDCNAVLQLISGCIALDSAHRLRAKDIVVHAFFNEE